MSFNENTEELVKGVCMLEYSHATREYGKKFHSKKEGYAVLKEEVEEVAEEYGQIKAFLEYLWYTIKSKEKIDYKKITHMQEHTIKAIEELAQVWAVSEKLKQTITDTPST